MNARTPTLPAGATLPTFPCPRCRKAHPWSEDHVEKLAMCSCGQVMKVPAEPYEAPAPATGGQRRPRQGPSTSGRAMPPAMPPGMPPAPPARAAARPAARAPAQDVTALVGMPTAAEPSAQVPDFLRMPAAPPPPSEALSPEVEAEMAALGAYGEKDALEPDPKRDTYVPLTLLAIGFVLTVLNIAWSMDAHGGVAVAGGVAGAVVKLVVGLVMMLLGALVAAKFAGINFGAVGPAILKLAGLCLAPSALGDLVTTLLGADMAVAVIGWTVTAVIHYALISYLFRLDGAQTVIVVFAIGIVRVVVTFVLGAVLLVGMGSMIEDAGERVRDGGDRSAVSSYDADEED